MEMSKQHILTLIKRIAAEGDGTPPGFRKFAKLTGIKTHQWRGKYWSRWPEALGEAGFQPNRPPDRLDEDSLVASFVRFAEGFGRIPTQSEMMMKNEQDNAFPGEWTFRRRFGSKQSLLKASYSWCLSHPGHESFVQLLPHSVVASVSSEAEIGETHPVEGEVYLIQSGRYYKIGMSVSTGRRLYEIGLKLPEQPKEVHVIKTDDPRGIEEYWHKRFAAKRTKGEWFDLDARDVAAFKRRKYQ